MKEQERDLTIYLEDILVSIRRIHEYRSGLSFDDFLDDQKTIDAVIRNFEIIGEASKNLPTEFKAKYEDVPWEEMYRLRNRVSHAYFGIDYDILWDIMTRHLPENEKQIKWILDVERKPVT